MFHPKVVVLLTVLLPIVISTPKKRSINSYVVEGCFSSVTGVGLNKEMGGHNSNIKCQEICRDQGYILAATRGDRCQCGNIYPKGKKVADKKCTSKCRSWAPCKGPQSCCGGPHAYSVSVVGNIDVAKQVLRRISHEWRTNDGYKKYMKSIVNKPGTRSHNEDWWRSFDRKGWSLCGRGRYLAGLYRSNHNGRDRIYHLEEARCVDAPGYLYSLEGDRICYDHDWWRSFDFQGWSLCNNGYYMAGLWRNSGDQLYHIEEARCCRPKSQVSSWGRCYNHNVWRSFDYQGWNLCKDGYYMAGLYRNSCNALYCLEEFKCCEMGPYGGYPSSWLNNPDFVIKVEDASGQLKQCSMNAGDISASSSTYKCEGISDRTNMLAVNPLKFNIEDKSPLNDAEPQPIKGFRPVICSAHSNSYKCTKTLKTSVSTSSSFMIGSGVSLAVTAGLSVEIKAGLLGVGSKSILSGEVSTATSFNVESSVAHTYTTEDTTDVSVQVPKNTEIQINLLRTVQDLEYKWKAIFQLFGKYSAKWENEQELYQDVTTVLSGSKREMYAFGSWSYPDTDVLRTVITDKYGNKKSEGCEHEAGKAKSCNL